MSTHDDTPENTGPQHAGRGEGGRFAGGTSGNPAGKPPGTRNATTLALEQLLDGEAQAITRAAIERAKAGDPQAMKLVLERVLPLRRGRPVRFTLPDIAGAADITKALGSILRATASGELTPDEAAVISTVLEAKRRAIETVELDARLSALEQHAKENER